MGYGEVVFNEEVAQQAVVSNQHGTASGEFSIPAGRMLGGWRLQSWPGNGNAAIRVEEYKRPTFEVKIDEPKQPLRHLDRSDRS